MSTSRLRPQVLRHENVATNDKAFRLVALILSTSLLHFLLPWPPPHTSLHFPFFSTPSLPHLLSSRSPPCSYHLLWSVSILCFPCPCHLTHLGKVNVKAKPQREEITHKELWGNAIHFTLLHSIEDSCCGTELNISSYLPSKFLRFHCPVWVFICIRCTFTEVKVQDDV